MRDDGVGHDGPPVGLVQALQDLVGQTVRREDREPQRRRIGDAHAVVIGGVDLQLRGELPHLRAGPVDENQPDVQAVQDREIQKEVVEVVRRQDRAVDVQHEEFVPEPGDIAQDATQIRCFHGPDGRRSLPSLQ